MPIDPAPILAYYARVFRFIEAMRFQVDEGRGEFVLLQAARIREALRQAVVPGTLRELFASGRRPPLPVPPEAVDFLEEKKVQESEGQAYAIGFPVVRDKKRGRLMPLLIVPVEARDDDMGNITISRKPSEIRENSTLLGRLMNNPPSLSGYFQTEREPEALGVFVEELGLEAEVGYDRGDAILSLPTLLDALLKGREDLEHVRDSAILYAFVDADFLFNLRQDYGTMLTRRNMGGTLPDVFARERRPLREAAPAYGLIDARELTPSQQKAAERIYSFALTPIEGPPGTGKTTLICAIAARTIVERALYAAGLSERCPTLLITSTNNKAVANVLEALRRADAAAGERFAPAYFAGGRRELVDESAMELVQLIDRLSKEKNIAENKAAAHARLATLKDRLDAEPGAWTAHVEIFAAAREFLYWHFAAHPPATLRPDLGAYLEAAEKGRGRRLATMVKDPDALLSICPVMLSTTLSIRNILPEGVCVKTAIIDEASQTLFPYAAPVFWRSSRTAVIGDENQLQPIVSIPPEELEELGAPLPGFEFGKSALGVIWTPDDKNVEGQVLREHFRCRPDIIRYCDIICRYGLVVKTRDESLAGELGLRGPILDAPLVFVDVQGEHEATNGSYKNDAEARVAAEILRRIWWSLAPKLATKDLRDMAGVLTPYRAQVSALRKEIAADAQLREFLRRRRDGRRLTVGTVHALQGDEKPVVVMSMVISGQGPGTMAFINKGRNLLNVAVSRAQRTLVLVGDRARIETETGTWVRELWAHFIEREKAGRALVAKWTELLSLSNW